MATYVKVMFSSYAFASRNRREVDVVTGLGHTVIVSDVSTVPGVEYEGDVAIWHRTAPSNPWRLIRKVLIVVDMLFILPVRLKKLHAKCLSCHGLLALGVGWLTTLGVPRARRPHLVYDSHEYEIGRTTAQPRTRLHKYIIKSLEAFLIARCAFTIAVNESIADRLCDIHRLSRRPIVVRSMPTTWQIAPDVVETRRRQFCQELNVLPSTLVAMYHGSISPGRGIENFFRALVVAPDTVGVILGNGDSAYREELDSLVERLGLHRRVLFHAAVPMSALPTYVAAADVGMVLIEPISESYYMSLPNKLFENIQALTPVIGSAYPEISHIIQRYDIGLVVDPTEPTLIAQALVRFRSDSSLRRRYLKNLVVARGELCWERERGVLRQAYEALMGPAGRPPTAPK